MTFYHGGPQEHLSMAKHLTAETKTEQFVARKGVVAKWERLRRQNHWLDAVYNACAAGHLAGVRLVDEMPTEAPPKPPASRDDCVSDQFMDRLRMRPYPAGCRRGSDSVSARTRWVYGIVPLP